MRRFASIERADIWKHMENGVFGGLMAVILSRAAERIALVAVGALAICLGYRLFQLIPGSGESEGKLTLPGGASIILTRIGPGVFFALFGAGLIGYCAARPVEFTVASILSALQPPSPEKAAAQASSQVSGLKYSGAVGMPDRPLPGSIGPEDVVARLNGLAEDARARLENQAAADEIAETVRIAKFAVMSFNWNRDWGDRAAFEHWVREGASSDPPLEEAPGAVKVFGTRLK